MLLQALCSISYPLVNSNLSYSPETLNSRQNRRLFEPCDLEILRMTLKTIYATSSFVHHFIPIGEFKLESQSGKAQFGSNSTIFRALRPCNLTDDLAKQQGTSSMLLQALCSISNPLVNSNWSYSPETPNLGQIRRFLEPCDLEIWWITLKNNRAPLLCYFKLCETFHYHMWIQTGVTVRKWLSWVVTSVTLTFDLWPWSFAWTLPWSVVITPENFMMMRWWEHSQKGVTDRQTDGQTDRQTDRQKIPFIELLGRS